MPYPKFLPALTPVNLPARRCPVPRPEASHRILLIKHLALGDVLMATPLASALRRAYPEAHITWQVERNYADTVAANPDIDEVLVWDGDYWNDLFPKRWKKWLNIPRRWLGLRGLAAALRLLWQVRRRRFDTLITLSAHEWPLLTLAVGAARTVGLEESGKPFRAGLYQSVLKVDASSAHRTDKYLQVLDALGLPPPQTDADKQTALGYTAADVAAVDIFLSENGAENGSGPLVVIAPRTTSLTRCWPEDRYSELGTRLQARGCRVIVAGSPREVEPIRRIAEAMHPYPTVAAGRLSVRELAALIGRASLLISGDTGPMHMAAAVRTPYLALFGPTPVRGRAPLAGRGISLVHSVPWGPCDSTECLHEGENHLLCLKRLSLAEVAEAAEALLRKDSPAP